MPLYPPPGGAQTVQTQDMVVVIGSGANGNGTFSSGTVSLKAGNNVTLSTGANVISIHAPAAGAGGAVNFSAGVSADDLSAVVFSNSGGVSWGLNGSTITATVSTAYQPLGAYLTTARASNDAIGLNTAQTQVTWTVNSSGFSLNAGAYLTTAAVSNHSHGNPTLALTNLLGTTNSASNGFTLSLDAGAHLTTAALSNHSHGNPTLALTNLSGTTASDSGGFTLSLAAAAPGGGAGIDRNMFELIDGERLVTIHNPALTALSNRPIFIPFWFDQASLSARTVRFLESGVASSNTLSLVCTMGIGFYSTSNSTRIDLVSSTSNAFSYTASSQWSGVRVVDVTGLSAFTLSEGRWIMGLWVSATATAQMNMRFYGGDPMPNVVGYLGGGTSTSATAAVSHFFPFWGYWSASSAALPVSAAISQISGGNSSQVFDVYAIIKEI